MKKTVNCWMMTEWTKVKNRKDMPCKSQDIMYMTEDGNVFSGYWNAHEKALYAKYDSEWAEDKFSLCRRGVKGVCAWTNEIKAPIEYMKA